MIGVTPLTAYLDAGGSQDPDGNIVSYSWDMGDGSTENGVVVQHVYLIPDNYTVQLTVTDDEGGTAQDEIGITVTGQYNQPPVATDLTVSTNEDTQLFDSFLL